jgi:succinate dehydrogenase/fumarate reductase flavoprotein subunit
MSLLVVGAGPARIAAALQARELGAEVTVKPTRPAAPASIVVRRRFGRWPEPPG